MESCIALAASTMRKFREILLSFLPLVGGTLRVMYVSISLFHDSPLPGSDLLRYFNLGRSIRYFRSQLGVRELLCARWS